MQKKRGDAVGDVINRFMCMFSLYWSFSYMRNFLHKEMIRLLFPLDCSLIPRNLHTHASTVARMATTTTSQRKEQRSSSCWSSCCSSNKISNISFCSSSDEDVQWQPHIPLRIIIIIILTVCSKEKEMSLSCLQLNKSWHYCCLPFDQQSKRKEISKSAKYQW